MPAALRRPARAARLVAVGLAGVFLLGGSPAAGAADPYREVSLALGQGLVALFPAAEGYVVSASGGEAYVDLARKDLLRPGMELQVYRPGAEMIHPVTRQVLGAYEKDLGVLSVTEVREKYSRGVLDEAGAKAGVTAGDRVRISARRLRTLLHVDGAAAGIEIGPLAQALLARGEESGRFAMLDEPAWAQSLAALGEPWKAVRSDPAALRRLGERAAADLLLLARVESGTVPGVAIEVRSLRTGTLMGDLSQRWPALEAPGDPPQDPAAPAVAAASVATPPTPAAPSPGSVAPSPAPEEYTVRELAAPARALAAGDILGEGQLEVVLADGARLSLYRWEEQALSWRWDEEGRGGRRIISLDAADVDLDGRTEVLVTLVVRGRVTSELRRWRDGSLQVVASIDGVYLRAAPLVGGSVLLLGQRAGFDEVLTGRVEQYGLRDDSFERVDGTILPRGVGVFGLALAPAGGPASFYSLDRAGFISRLTLEGELSWRSPRPYGGYPPPVTARELFGRSLLDEGNFDDETRAFSGRLLAEQTPGGVRLIVPRNFSDSPLLLVRLRAVGRGEVVILEGPPESPEEVLRSRAYDGYVADFARVEIDGGPVILFVVNRSAGPLLGDRGKLVAWRPGGGAAGGR